MMGLDDHEEFEVATGTQEETKVVEPVKEPVADTVLKPAKKTAKSAKEKQAKQVVEEKVEEKTDEISESPSIGELAEENRRLQEENSKLTDLLNAQPKTQEIQKEDKKETVSSLLNKLYTLVKEQRTILLLEALKENYFKLKYKSFSVTEIQKMNQQISEKFLAQSLEGKVRAVINANEE